MLIKYNFCINLNSRDLKFIVTLKFFLNKIIRYLRLLLPYPSLVVFDFNEQVWWFTQYSCL